MAKTPGPGESHVSEFDLRPPTDKQREQITVGLTPEERDVLLEHGTEAPFCGVFLGSHTKFVASAPLKSPDVPSGGLGNPRPGSGCLS